MNQEFNVDINEILENPSIYIDQHLEIEGILTKYKRSFRERFSVVTLSGDGNKDILIEMQSPEERPTSGEISGNILADIQQDIQSRLSNFLRMVEGSENKKYSLQEAEDFLTAFQRTGELQYLDVLRQIISEDELAILFPYFSGKRVTYDLYSQLDSVPGDNYRDEIFQASISGVLKRADFDKEQLILTDVQEIVLLREACTYYLHAVESQFDQLVLNLLPTTPLQTILAQCEAYAEQIVSIKGTFFDYGIQHFIVPNTAYLSLKNPIEMAIMVDDLRFIEVMKKNIYELMGGKYARVVDVYVVGKIALSDVFPKRTSITEITTAYIRDRTITFKWDNYQLSK